MKRHLLIEIDCEDEYCGGCSGKRKLHRMKPTVCVFFGNKRLECPEITDEQQKTLSSDERLSIMRSGSTHLRCHECKAARAPITMERASYREVVWCPYLNEPEILEYRGSAEDRHPFCRGCGDGHGRSSYEESTHPFLFRVLKPMD